MVAWRSHLNTISTASELDEEISLNKETSADNGIPLEGYADKSDQVEASGDEPKISRVFGWNLQLEEEKIIFTNSKNSKNNDVYKQA